MVSGIGGTSVYANEAAVNASGIFCTDSTINDLDSTIAVSGYSEAGGRYKRPQSLRALLWE